ncbi:uncharacterized protein METZ01_LOCUS73466 [marine metagenome]|uniref:7-cyano-7-deazaguanine synthase n=1 Tax=marine metagenome TaxID=408172 RepID=A0A381TX80_9ZZZZ|tara:strand:- start:522 stop:1175 length:654 start_codon:yes stop_codon:yes gene_type:complete
MTKIVVVYSGGMDSFTLINFALKQDHEVSAISFDYGQKHRKELDSATDFCKSRSISLEVSNISGIKPLLKGSALTDNIEVPRGHYEDQTMKMTVVPNRNMIMISLSIAYAISIDFEEVWYGAHSGDHSIYPDCRPEFLESVNKTSKLANYESIEIRAPFINLSKSEILSKGLGMNLDYSQTWTCYEGKVQACGKCGACVERLEAFEENNEKDPIEYF